MNNCGVKSSNLISSITKNPDGYDEKYIKIKSDSNDELPLNKPIEISSWTTVVRAVFMKITNIIHKFFI